LVWLLISVMPFGARGATIILKNGTRLETPKLWVDNAQIHFVLDGLPAVIAPKDIAELIDAPSAVTLALAKLSTEPARNKPAAAPPKPPSPHLPAGPAEAPAHNGGDNSLGFQDLTWDTGVADLPGLEQFDIDPSFGGIVLYKRPSAGMDFGAARLTEALYGFWRERFYTVSLLVAGKDQFEALKAEAFRRFGPGIRSDEVREVYVWFGSATDRMLEFDAANELGLLWMRSAELNEEVARAVAVNINGPLVP